MKTRKKRSAKSKKKKKIVQIPDRKLRLVYEPISKLKLWENNPRRNSEAADKLVSSLQEHGFIQPIVVSDGGDGTIWAGNTRFKAAKKAGLKEVPVLYVNFKSTKEAENFALIDNKSNEWSEWDESLLSDLFQQRGEIDKDRLERLTGFSQGEIAGLVDGNLEGYFNGLADDSEGEDEDGKGGDRNQGDRSEVSNFRSLVISGERSMMDELRRIIQVAQERLEVKTMAEALMKIAATWEKRNGRREVRSDLRTRRAKRRIK